MTELDHDDLTYAGQQGENVTVTVQPDNTTQLVSYTLEGQSRPLSPGESIRFSLVKKSGDQPMVLELNMDFNAEGSYEVVVRNVQNEPNNECVHEWDGPPLAIKIFRFFVN